MTSCELALQGLMTVRAFRAQDAHAAEQANLLQQDLKVSLPMIAVDHWLGVRTEGMSAIVVAVVAITCTVLLPRRQVLIIIWQHPSCFISFAHRIWSR